MHSVSFTLQLRPVSINDAYYRAGQLKTASRKYRYELLSQLLVYKDEIKAFRTEALDLINNHSQVVGGRSYATYALKLKIVHLVPKDLYFTKQGQMSMRAGDVSNLIKLLEDFIFNTRYCEPACKETGKPAFELQDGQYATNIGIDDRFIQTITTSKLPYNGDRWQIEIIVSVEPIKSK